MKIEFKITSQKFKCHIHDVKLMREIKHTEITCKKPKTNLRVPSDAILLIYLDYCGGRLSDLGGGESRNVARW